MLIPGKDNHPDSLTIYKKYQQKLFNYYFYIFTQPVA
ncbi:hypothetical protein SAMN05428975_5330 [Mucilaginibacter sp. OK268]|nr:hypothetical protein SAMN05428975_5330 [Mucilaginibacter sp. OK268]